MVSPGPRSCAFAVASLIACSAPERASPAPAPGPGATAAPAKATALASNNDCAALCARRPAPGTGMGFCAPIFPEATDCPSYCAAHLAAWSAADQQAFARCIEKDPLCYQTMDSCIRGGK